MPQMMPMNWLIMSLIFVSMLIIFNTFNFFITSSNPPLTLKTLTSTQKLIWKW